jgi:hypothetical protein
MIDEVEAEMWIVICWPMRMSMESRDHLLLRK